MNVYEYMYVWTWKAQLYKARNTESESRYFGPAWIQLAEVPDQWEIAAFDYTGWRANWSASWSAETDSRYVEAWLLLNLMKYW